MMTRMELILRQWRPVAVLALICVAPACGTDGETPLPGDDAAAAADGGAATDAAPLIDAGTGPEVLLSSDGPGREGGALYGDQPFSIVLLPDTQFYTQSYPEMFDAETKWIVDHREDPTPHPIAGAPSPLAFVL